MTDHTLLSTSSTRVVTRPNSFIFTMFGDLAYEAAQAKGETPAVWIGGLISLVAAFGISSAAVRQSVSRMSRQGWLEAGKHGTRAYYHVTQRGADRIASLSP